MPQIAILADDLTGANDTGVQFSKYGLRTSVSLSDTFRSDAFEKMDVWVMDTDSRAITSSEAAKRVREYCQRLQTQPLDTLYKKIDSTLRGNVGAEIAAASEEYEPLLTVIAPAYPKARRYTIGGYQLLEGIPISLTEFARDPQRPVTEAYLPRLLGTETGAEVGIVPLQVVMDGTKAVHEMITRQLAAGCNRLIFDAVSDIDLKHIAEAASSFAKVLWVGSAGLAEQLPPVYRWKSGNAVIRTASSSVLVVAGSVSAVTQAQLQYYIRQTGAINILIDPVAAILTPADETARLIAATAPLLGAREMVISCSNQSAVINQAIAAGQSAGFAANEVGAQIACVLAGAVQRLVELGVDGLFLTGGETAVHCCRSLEAGGIEILAEVAPGIPLGRLTGGRFAGLSVVTKAGGFGDVDAIERGIQILRKRGEP